MELRFVDVESPFGDSKLKLKKNGCGHITQVHNYGLISFVIKLSSKNDQKNLIMMISDKYCSWKKILSVLWIFHSHSWSKNHFKVFRNDLCKIPFIIFESLKTGTHLSDWHEKNIKLKLLLVLSPIIILLYIHVHFRWQFLISQKNLSKCAYTMHVFIILKTKQIQAKSRFELGQFSSNFDTIFLGARTLVEFEKMCPFKFWMFFLSSR